MDLVFSIMLVEIFIKECGRMINNRDKENLSGKMVTDTKEIIQMAK